MSVSEMAPPPMIPPLPRNSLGPSQGVVDDLPEPLSRCTGCMRHHKRACCGTNPPWRELWCGEEGPALAPLVCPPYWCNS